MENSDKENNKEKIENEVQGIDSAKQKKKFSFLKYARVLAIVVLLSVGSYTAYTEYNDKKLEELANQAKLEAEKAEQAELEAQKAKEEQNAKKAARPKPTKKPIETPPPKVVRPEYAKIAKEFGNDDFIGVLKIEDTSIDYPIVQSKDNADYLEKDIFKKPSNAGTIFADYENDASREDKNFILYGHNMKADTMFHAIRKYRDEKFFKEHNLITFNTLYEDQTWEIFSFYKTDTKFPYTTVNFQSDAQYEALLKEMKRKSMFDSGIDVSKNDRILTLSTCTNIEEDTRYVVHARLIKSSNPYAAINQPHESAGGVASIK